MKEARETKNSFNSPFKLHDKIRKMSPHRIEREDDFSNQKIIQKNFFMNNSNLKTAF